MAFACSMRELLRGPDLFHVQAEFEVPHAPGVPPQRLLRNPQLASGQGSTLEEAQRKARGEAVERYSIVLQGNEPQLLATYEELGPDEAVAPWELGQYSEAQFRGRDAWNNQWRGFPYIPLRYEPQWPIFWTEAWSLTGNKPKYVPSQYCYMACTPPTMPLYLVCDSNGCAAGETLEDAFTRGFLELVERDAIAIWWANRMAPRALGDEGILADLTTDLGIPVIAAFGRRMGMGFGASFDATQAKRRALFELEQVATGLEQEDASKLREGSMEAAFVRWAQRTNLAELPHFQPQPRPAAALAASHDCVEIARQAGLEVLVLDVTRPETGMHAVRVIVPGLRSPWHRLAPGRLYEVPVRMGWLEQARREEEMNPEPYTL